MHSRRARGACDIAGATGNGPRHTPLASRAANRSRILAGWAGQTRAEVLMQCERAAGCSALAVKDFMPRLVVARARIHFPCRKRRGRRPRHRRNRMAREKRHIVDRLTEKSFRTCNCQNIQCYTHAPCALHTRLRTPNRHAYIPNTKQNDRRGLVAIIILRATFAGATIFGCTGIALAIAITGHPLFRSGLASRGTNQGARRFATNTVPRGL